MVELDGLPERAGWIAGEYCLKFTWPKEASFKNKNTLQYRNMLSNLECSSNLTMILCCSRLSSPTPPPFCPLQPQPPANLGVDVDVLGIWAVWHHITQVLSAMLQGSSRLWWVAVPQFLVANNGPVSSSVPLLRGHLSCFCRHRGIVSTVVSMCKPFSSVLSLYVPMGMLSLGMGWCILPAVANNWL